MKNIFQLIDKTEEDVQDKIKSAFRQLFYGDPKNESVCFATGELKYIVDIGHTDIRSEGMSYGMFITARLGQKEDFAALWNFAKRYLQNKGNDYAPYFSWQVGLPDESHSGFYMMDPGAAPDGEEYFAAALLLAAKKFNNPEYKREACELLRSMKEKETAGKVRSMFDKNRAMVRFSPMEENDYTDPSYHTLAFYRLFAKETGDSFWEKVYEQSIDYLKKAVHPKTGLSADYSEFNGEPKLTDFNPMSGYFSGDAWRVAMNLALDYNVNIPSICENKRNEAKTFEKETCRTLLRFFKSHQPNKADYKIDGSEVQNARELTIGLIAMNAAATSALDWENTDDAVLAKPFLNLLWHTPVPTGTWRYYDGLLYLLGMLSLTDFNS